METDAIKSKKGKHHQLGEMTWEEAKKAYQEYDFVALVCASHEQHSTHLPLLTDSIIGEYFANRLAEEAEREGIIILLLPTLWLGYSEEHANFPGTVTLSPHTLEDILLDVARSLKRHGVKRFLVINSHGGNFPVVQLAVDRIERDIGLQAHLLNWTSFGDYPKSAVASERPEPLKINHAGDSETAMLMCARPDLVRSEKMRTPKLKQLAITRSWWGARYWEDFTDTGSGSDPHNPDVPAAEEFYKRAVSNSIYALKKDLSAENKNQ
ncbi:MAG TPA: creatininase family protein [Nitrososphaerales archaeon]|nr:creatininase family protein [Nitrososphaerales archaeon]